MKLLCNGCSRSDIAVTPKNWNSPKASIKRKWRIYYRFYDPAFRDEPKYKKGKMVAIRGMNKFYTLEERQSITEGLLSQEMDLLDNQGYNPITGKLQEPDVIDTCEFLVMPQTGFTKALAEAVPKLTGDRHTIACARSVVKYITVAANQLHYNGIQISDIKRRHIIKVLEKCGEIKKKWSAHNYNFYRANLMMVFKLLMRYEVIEENPVVGTEKKKSTTRIKEVLNLKERKITSETLKERHYYFWLFVNIFFHSGARLRELFRLQGKAVDIVNQRYKDEIRKGKIIREVWRPIKDIALQYWAEIMSTCNPEDYIFGKGFRPGKRMHSTRATRVWNILVKKEMGITADLYSLKHLNIDETAAALSIKDAQRMAEHTTPVITMDVYAIGEKERQMERLKKVNNPF